MNIDGKLTNKTKRSFYLFVLAVGIFVFSLGKIDAQELNASPQTLVDFNRQIKPILSDRCFLCHGPDAETREADLRLDTEEGAAAAIEAGDHESSELYSRITSDNEDEVMPPPNSNLSLNEEEKVLLKRWIDEGANWRKHWAFVVPRKSTPPAVANKSSVFNEIDQFVLAKLKKSNIPESLFPATKATKEKLLRRVSFDLTGLPPTLKELDEFLADESGNAYEKAVDRLLGSSRYGERMASDWLDLARYSDTYGYQVDRDRFVWPWRDWVIKSFNKNMKYDQFITEQLAGDLLPGATDDQILATTFNRLHPQKVEGGSVEEEFRVEYVADRSQTVGMAFMGLTVECARCHDHKYDPISQKEYYQLFAFFNSIDEAGLYSYFDPAAVPTPTLMLADNIKKKALADQLATIVGLEEKVEALETAKDKTNDAAIAFGKWLADVDARKKLAGKIDPAVPVDFEKHANKNNVLVDGPVINDGESLKALKLTGDDEVKLKLGAFQRHQPFTISTRIKLPDDQKLLKRTVIYHRSRAWTDSASRGYQLLVEDGNFSASLIHFWPGNAISVRTKRVIPTEKWLSVAVVYDGSSRASGLRIFVDGKLEPVEIVRDNLKKQITGAGTDHLILGARFRDFGFKNGQLADFKVIDCELSSVEIAGLHDNGFLKKLLSDNLLNADTDLLWLYYLAIHDKGYKKLQQALTDERKKLNAMMDGMKEIMVMKELDQPRQAYVLHRGAYDARREEVKPNTLSVFPPMPKPEISRTETVETDGPTRLTLARWLTIPDHPLTARVAVNHYWQLCFGAGLVRTPEDFGSQGQPPTHPELLDWLAVDFQENGWDIKRLLKQIVLSRTYQQSTSASKELLTLDPENRLLARAPTYRLPAEMLRDNVLATSGLLVEKIGGAPVRPYELAASFKPSTPDKGEGLYRRSIYTYWKRTGPAPVMLTLDAAKRDVCQVKRERTSSPLAALVQLNNPQTVESSRKLAEGLMKRHSSGEESKAKIATDIFRTLTSRFPFDKERSILEQLFESQLEYFNNDESATKKIPWRWRFEIGNPNARRIGCLGLRC